MAKPATQHGIASSIRIKTMVQDWVEIPKLDAFHPVAVSTEPPLSITEVMAGTFQSQDSTAVAMAKKENL